MPQYKLDYFDTEGRGEQIRLLFHLKGQEFEDNRVQFQDWPGMKAGLDGGSIETRSRVDEALYALDDVLQAFFPVFKAMMSGDEGAISKAKDEFVEKAKKIYANLDKFINKHGKGYMVGSEPTSADVKLLDAVQVTARVAGSEEFLKHHEPVRKVYEQIKTQGNLPTYLDSRQQAVQQQAES